MAPELLTVTATLMPSTDPELVTVEHCTRGRTRATVPRCVRGKVTQSRDDPNTLGIAKAAGVLPQLAASLE